MSEDGALDLSVLPERPAHFGTINTSDHTKPDWLFISIFFVVVGEALSGLNFAECLK